MLCTSHPPIHPSTYLPTQHLPPNPLPNLRIAFPAYSVICAFATLTTLVWCPRLRTGRGSILARGSYECCRGVVGGEGGGIGVLVAREYEMDYRGERLGCACLLIFLLIHVMISLTSCFHTLQWRPAYAVYVM